MIQGIFAKPGSGKTIYLAICALAAGSSRLVYSTSYINGTYKLSFEDLADKKCSEGALILIDEITSYADNRDFKSTKKGVIQYVTNHRHYGHDIVWCSQHFDAVDKKIRTNTENLFKVSMVGIFSIGNPNNRPLLKLYGKAPGWLARIIGWIPFVRPRIKLTRYVPCVGYQRPYKGGFGQLVDGHDAPAEGLAGLLQRLLMPGYWVIKKTITQAALRAFDTHDDQIGYRDRPEVELVPW
jgi:hypothetical protein